ncbi:XdhC/CoxI family protein [Aliarcobacter butzleri]|uniref:XdhC family protein n=1 Tax=Aliarcobacter butzleri TaxID=28197 RepID=UPI003208134D
MYLDKKILDFIESSQNRKLDIALTSVVETTGSTYAKVGNIMLVNSQNEFTGVLGSSYLHNKIFELSHQAISSKEIQYFESIAQDESSGHGNSKYKIEPFFYEENYEKLEKSLKNPFSLLIFGSGAHVTTLILMANLMGWKTTIIDVKMNNEFVKDADEKIELKNLEDILTMDLNSFDASVILSHSPKTDDSYLKALVNSNINYIGMMGNKKNMQRIKKEFDLETDKRFFAPIGLDIGGNTAQSIALSICAQIEAKKNNKI